MNFYILESGPKIFIVPPPPPPQYFVWSQEPNQIFEIGPNEINHLPHSLGPWSLQSPNTTQQKRPSPNHQYHNRKRKKKKKETFTGFTAFTSTVQYFIEVVII